MADLEFTRTFTHQDWIDEEDIVQAEGENGFNGRFHAVEHDFDRIGELFAQVGEALEERGGAEPVATLSKQLGPNEVTDIEEIDDYAVADYPNGLRKLYQVALEPFGRFHGQVSHQFIYSPIGEERVRVSIWFKNERDAMTRVTAYVFSLN